MTRKEYDLVFQAFKSYRVYMTDDTGYITEHLVITNYIKGETDAKGFTPKSNSTILIDNYGKRTTVHDYRKLDILVNIDEY